MDPTTDQHYKEGALYLHCADVLTYYADIPVYSAYKYYSIFHKTMGFAHLPSPEGFLTSH